MTTARSFARVLLAASALLASGCWFRGPELQLPGHEYRYVRSKGRELPPITMKVGQVTKLVVYHGGSHMHANRTIVATEQPGLVEVFDRRDEDQQRATYVRALRPGTSRAHYVHSAPAVDDGEGMKIVRADLADRQRRVRNAIRDHGRDEAMLDRYDPDWRDVVDVELEPLSDEQARALYLRVESVGSFTLTVTP